MLTYPDIDPVAFQLGPLRVHWYGLMYLVGFALGWALGRWRASRPGSGWTAAMVDDVIFYAVIGIIAGGRLGYMFFYGYDQILANPLNVLRVWEGGMSFHGGLIGVMVAIWLFGRKHGSGWPTSSRRWCRRASSPGASATSSTASSGATPRRCPGPCSSPACAFRSIAPGSPPAPRSAPRCTRRSSTRPGSKGSCCSSCSGGSHLAVSGLFLLLYGLFRFSVEFVRQPDAHIGYVAFDWLTMGQLLSLPMLVGGAVMLALAYALRGSGRVAPDAAG